MSEKKKSVAEAVQPASNLPTVPPPKADSPKSSESKDADNQTPITLAELIALKKLRLEKKALKELIPSKVHSQLISNCLASPVNDVALKCGSLAPCPLAPELKLTSTAIVADSAKGDDVGDWKDWGD